jgi:hypothetical protein
MNLQGTTRVDGMPGLLFPIEVFPGYSHFSVSLSSARNALNDIRGMGCDA